MELHLLSAILLHIVCGNNRHFLSVFLCSAVPETSCAKPAPVELPFINLRTLRLPQAGVQLSSTGTRAAPRGRFVSYTSGALNSSYYINLLYLYYEHDCAL
jgi:hypothetical protein